MGYFRPDSAKPRRRLSSDLTILFGLAGIVVWQLAQPSHIWPFNMLGGIGGAARSLDILGLLGITLIVTLDLIRRHLVQPIRDLLAYVKCQNEGPSCDPPVVLLERTDEVGRLANEIQRMLGTLKDQNDKLMEKTLNDPLTGLGNRRLLEQRLDTALPISRRRMTPISVLMIDVDHFKAYNDYYGHPAGDECLTEIANVLRDTFRRETDILVRLGGEEFLVVLLDVGIDDSLQMAEAMRSMLQLVAIPHEKSSTAPVVTVSVGVATVEPGMPIDVDALIACADSALYQCKSQGRNRSLHSAINADRAPMPWGFPDQGMAEDAFQSIH